MASMTPARVRRIRKALGFTQEEFARTIWVTYTTLNRWEAGRACPTGMHLRILRLLEENMTKPTFQAVLRDPRASDPMFLLQRMLDPLYGDAERGQGGRSYTLAKERSQRGS
ncbi:MAG: helix-turn-helix domain-containing protein [Candidatus Acidiferrales bacterium]